MKTLSDIIEYKKEEVNIKKKLLTLTQIKDESCYYIPTRPFLKQIESNKSKLSIISEIKKASPSAGLISKDFDPVAKAEEYESFGASALSILTEEDYFQGNIQHLIDVKAVSNLPILRKDFIVDEYQIFESKLIGADCILLIASILNDDELKLFSELAEKLYLDYIIEVHDKDELLRVKNYSKAIIGVNNRNLKTFEVDIDNSIKLKKEFQESNIFVSESGIKTQKDIDKLKEHNINVFLIGESLMKGDFF